MKASRTNGPKLGDRARKPERMDNTTNTRTTEAKPVSLDHMVGLLNAITEAVREMERCPDDSTQDIWNESLESWRTGLRMNHRLEIEEDPDDRTELRMRDSAATTTPKI